MLPPPVGRFPGGKDCAGGERAEPRRAALAPGHLVAEHESDRDDEPEHGQEFQDGGNSDPLGAPFYQAGRAPASGGTARYATATASPRMALRSGHRSALRFLAAVDLCPSLVPGRSTAGLLIAVDPIASRELLLSECLLGRHLRYGVVDCDR